MEGLSQNCYNLAHRNSKVFFFFGGEVGGIYIYLTHSYTQTQYQVMEYFSLPFTVLWAQRQDTQKSPLAHLQDLARSTESFSLVDHWWSPNCCTFRAHTIVNDRLKYRIVSNVLAFRGREKSSRRQELVPIASR